MSIIKLDQNTINHIAAGEVIDRPSSIVKELVENSIDANATNISIEIKDGGISLIRITDNGDGIDESDIKIAFERHSTSKIKDTIDLASIHSLGFRGEALSSIAAVCQVELITKTKESMTGFRYRIEGDEEIGFEEIGAPDGTTFIVRNIFFNTPARRKFLKTASTESGYISEIIEKIALSHPEISFTFINNGKTRIYTPGNGNLKDTIYAIYGKEVTDNLVEVNYKDKNIEMTGFLGKAIISKGNRSNENYFINGRYIKSDIISKAIEEGYKFILMQHKYPFTVVNFAIDSKFIDVNVHPSKMELRISNASEIYPAIVETVKEALIEKPNIIDAKIDDEKKTEEKIDRKPEPFETKRNTVEVKQEVVPEKKTNIPKPKSTDYTNIEKPKQEEVHEQMSYDFLSEEARPKHKIIGQVFETYWIVEYEDEMYIIDQHAAHEKVNFERLMKRFENNDISSQTLTQPIILNLSMKDANIVEQYLDNFNEIGFVIEPFQGTDFAVRAVPSELYTLDSEDVLMDIIDNFTAEIGSMVPNIVTEKIASMSCKASIKGNTKISFAEADALIDELLSCENPYNCPHGRPTIIKMSKEELEKKFKRIV